MTVDLRSDGETLVAITGAKFIGKFRQMSLMLPGGTYDVVGTRKGYRSVKPVVFVAEDLQPVSLSVVCTTEAP